MKYIVILGDGWADYPDKNGNTPLSLANKPAIDNLAKVSRLGLCKTVPDGMKPGSDVANMSVMGFDPHVYYTGRSPLEAASMGIELGDSDVTFRCNLVTLDGDGDYESLKMKDYSAGEISSKEAAALIKELTEKIQLPSGCELKAGVSYRHCFVHRNALERGAILTPPHDISGRPIKDYLPKGAFGEEILSFMKQSREILSKSEINKKRIAAGKNPANSCWLWGEGTKPSFGSFKELHGLKGAVISAVDLVKGIGKLAGMDVIDVEGACGTIDTNFPGKAKAALDAIKKCDYVYIHMEAPDECGHHGDLEGKIKSIELIDSLVVKPIFEEMTKRGEPFRLLITPDHPTPVSIMTHVSDPVPFMIYDSTLKENGQSSYDEKTCEKAGCFVPSGKDLFKLFTE